jgi:hypothetical protein
VRANVVTIVVVAFAIALTTRTAHAAPRVVRGVVMAADTGRFVVGATVLTDRGDVAVTDADGYFAVSIDAASTATPKGRELTVTAPGFATRTVRVPILDDERLVRVALATSHGSEVIEVYGTAPEETRPLSYQLTADEIRFLPGAANDILRAAQALPGVSRIPFAFGGLVLRGTSPRDTSVYLDGIEVPLAFHFGGISSFYPGTMLSELTVTSGGFDVSHGRAQGGLVTLTTREPRTDVWRVGGSIGLLDSSVFAEGPVKGGGIIVGVRRSYLDTIVSPFVADDVPLPSYLDAQVRTSFGDPRDRGRITPMIFASVDRVVNDEFRVTSLFVRAAVPFTRIWGPLTLRVVPWIGWTQLSFTDRESSGEDTLSRPSIPGGIRSELVRDYAWGHLRGGLDLDGGYLAQTEVDIGADRRETGSTLWWTDTSLWGETRVKLAGDRASIKPGLRLDYYGISRELVVDPRLNIHQQLTQSLVLRQAIGRYHQPPIPADLDPNDGNPKLDSSYMDQASLGVDAQLADRWLASITSFASYGHDIGVHVAHGNEGDIDPNLGGLGPTFQLLLEKQLGFSDYRENLGRARQVGLELLVKRSTERWFFLLSYTLSWSQRVDDPRDGRGWRPFELDQRHNLNVAGSMKLTKWRLGARVQLVSGNPYSPTINFTEIPVQDPFAGRLPPFFHLDLRADRRWERDWGDINLYFDIVNVTNRRNVEGRDYVIDNEHPIGYDQNIPGLPVLPFIGVEFIPN